MGKIDVWTLHKSKRVLVTDDPGVPVEATGYISAEAKQAAEARGHATVSEIGFNRDDHASFDDWVAAEEFAHKKSSENGYTVEVHSIFEAWADPSDDEMDDDDYFDETDDDPDFEEMYDPVRDDGEYDEDDDTDEGAANWAAYYHDDDADDVIMDAGEE